MEFISYKKIIIFGSEGSGKTSLTSRIENNSFVEVVPTASCN